MITPGPWEYVDGEVRHGDDVVARADRDTECRIKPAVRDANMRAIAALPELIKAMDGALGALAGDNGEAGEMELRERNRDAAGLLRDALRKAGVL